MAIIIRNWLCGLFAYCLILSGQVRRARRRALRGDVITAIYFHRPNERLFVRCIDWLIKHGYTVMSLDEVLECLRGAKPLSNGAVWISFDDGWRELLNGVLPLVHERKIPVTLFIPAGILERDGLFPWFHDPSHPSFSPGSRQSRLPVSGAREAMTPAELVQIAGYPEVSIGSHTVNHPLTTCCSDEKVRFEVGESKRMLESWTGRAVKAFAYPEGRFDGRERQFLIEFGYEMAATTENEFVTLGTDLYLLPRFAVADDISFPEAICNMVGVWRLATDPVKTLLRRGMDVLRVVRPGVASGRDAQEAECRAQAGCGATSERLRTTTRTATSGRT